MEKDFDQLNYYENAGYKTGRARSGNSQRLQFRLAQMYQSDSLVSYSFFSPKERKEIITLLEKAYFTLINEKERESYDNELIRFGKLSILRKKPRQLKVLSVFLILPGRGIHPVC